METKRDIEKYKTLSEISSFLWAMHHKFLHIDPQLSSGLRRAAIRIRDVNHFEQCLDMQEASLEKTAEYWFLWPHHCKNCRGWGGESYSYDPSPSGVSLGAGSMQDYDPCPECTDVGICPRCGRELYDPHNPEIPYDELDQCPHCDFDFAYPDGEPFLYECSCYFVSEYVSKHKRWKEI